MNFKTPFKVLTTAALIGTLSLSAVAPGVASAADKTVTAQAETPANFALEKVILVKGDSKISVSFDTYIDVLGNEKALNGYELAYVVAANGEVFALDTYVDFYEAGNTEEEVVEKLSKAGKTSEVTEVKDGAFNDGKLEPVEDTAATAKADLEKAVAAAKATEIKDAAAKAELTKAIEAAEKAAAKEDATKEELEAAKAELTKAVAAAKKADEEAALEAKVESVTAINATQVEVKFNKAVKKSSVIAETTSGSETAGTLVNGVFAFAKIDSSIITADDATGELSKDGKTLTITAKSSEKFEGRYDITIDGVKTTDDKVLEKYTAKSVDFGKDTTAPTITGTERISASKVKVVFSEPVNITAGQATADTTGTKAVKAGGTSDVIASVGTALSKEFVIDLSDASIAAGKEVKVTFNGVEDANGNLINPQPATVTVKKETSNAVAPEIAAVTQTGAKTFTLKFKEAATLAATAGTITASNVTIGGTAASTIEKVSDTEYKVTAAAILDGIKEIKVLKAGVTNIDGKAPEADLTKSVNFVADKEAPKATKTELVTTKTGAQALQVTFDKDVVVGSGAGTGAIKINGSFTDESYVTTKITPDLAATAVYADGKGDNKKVVNIPLATDNTLASNLAVENATYKLKITNKDTTNGLFSEAGTAIDEVTAEFKRGKDTTAATENTDVAVVDSAVQGSTNDEVTVTFTVATGSLDGATATNAANYTVNGAEVESATLLAKDTTPGTTTQTVTLKLKKDSNTFTGARNVTVKGVKIAGSTKVMEETTIKSGSLNENVLPTLTKAEITDAKVIKLTFSEKINSTDKDAFVVKAGDATVTQAVAGAAAQADGTVTITLAADLTAAEIAKGITVSPSTDSSKFVVKDAADNALEKFTAVTAVSAAQ